MSSDQHEWPSLSRKTALRLKAFAHPTDPTVTMVPCRLPGCGAWIPRGNTPGRPRWFHARRCADEFRTRQRALDVAIEELMQAFVAAPEAKRAQIRSELELLIEMRGMYVTPGAWRSDALTAGSPTAESFDDSFIQAVRDTRAKPDPCPTCLGDGNLSRYRTLPSSDEMKRQREAHDRLVNAAELLQQIVQDHPSLAHIEALEAVQQQANLTATALQRRLHG